jgi:hypothetical protein
MVIQPGSGTLCISYVALSKTLYDYCYEKEIFKPIRTLYKL